MDDGIIQLNTARGNELGFTPDHFAGYSYLWKQGDDITISLIETRKKGQGHLSQLFNNIESAGYNVLVPTPFAHMKAILERKGFVRTFAQDLIMGNVEIWKKPSQNCTTAAPPKRG